MWAGAVICKCSENTGVLQEILNFQGKHGNVPWYKTTLLPAWDNSVSSLHPIIAQSYFLMVSLIKSKYFDKKKKQVRKTGNEGGSLQSDSMI